MKKYRLFSVLLTAVLLLSGCTGGKKASESPSEKSSPAVQSAAQDSGNTSDDSPASVSSTPESKETESSESSSGEENVDLSQLYDIDSKYFVNRLNNKEKKAFLKLYTSALAHEDNAKLDEGISEETLDKLMLLLNYDCPELIHLKGDYSPIYNEGKGQVVTVKFYYNMDKDEYEHAISEMKNYFLLMKKELKSKTAYETEKAVYDRIFEECIYDEQDKDSGSVYGALIKRKARCEGISKAFMWCMRELGFNCITLLGTPRWDNDALYPNHSWNMIQIDNDWYHVDITCDNVQREASDTNPPLYSFLNANDDIIYVTRDLNSLYSSMEYPKSTASGLYYHNLNHSLIKSGDDPQERMNEIFREHFRSGEINSIAIRLDSYDEYNRTLGMWEKWTDEYLSKNESGNYETEFYYKRISWTIAIRVIPT